MEEAKAEKKGFFKRLFSKEKTPEKSEVEPSTNEVVPDPSPASSAAEQEPAREAAPEITEPEAQPVEDGRKKGFLSRIFAREEESPAEETVDSEPEAEQGMTETSADESDAVTPDAIEPEEPEDTQEEEKRGGFLRLVKGLAKTRTSFLSEIDAVFSGKREIDSKLLGRLEEILVTADIGVQTAYELLESVTERVKRKEINDSDALMDHLKTVIFEILSQVESPLRVGFGPDPFVVMVVGVNGSGKTTTIAKIAARHKAAGGKVLMVAGDTYRAAAVEQMQVWASRIGCPVEMGKEKADPSSVAYTAMERALKEGMELVLVDTAGRLHTRIPLMDQLKKMRRTLSKKYPAAPHETLLVIDASNGQNAILQARQFNEATPVTGIAITKLDGTSKGGVLVGISNELKIPVRYVGVGERMDDLRDFNARDFTEALFSDVKIGACG
ncbi:MAG: signal recognition particle-docking protein FtsY [Pseudomonadota bacterium]